MGFKENLKGIRMERGITQKALGASLGVTPVTIGNWERGVREPSIDLLAKLADALKTSTDVLLGHDCACLETSADRLIASFIKKYKALDAHGKQVVDTVCSMEYERVEQNSKIVQFSKNEKQRRVSKNRYIPFYLSPPAAGYGTPLEGDDFEMLLTDENVPEDADYALRVSGDSMEPYIQDGQMVFVKEADELGDGDVGIFSVNGEMYCKQYYVGENRDLHLLSANPDRAGASVHIPYDSGYTVKCCGKVLLDFRIPLPDYFFED